MLDNRQRKSATELAQIIRERLNIPLGIVIDIFPHHELGWFAVASEGWTRDAPVQRQIEDELLPELRMLYVLAAE